MEESDKLKAVLSLLNSLNLTKETMQQLIVILRVTEGFGGGIGNVYKPLKMHDAGVHDRARSEDEILADLKRQLREK